MGEEPNDGALRTIFEVATTADFPACVSCPGLHLTGYDVLALAIKGRVTLQVFG